MADLVDPYGYPVSARQFQDLSRRTSRPFWPSVTQDQPKDVPDDDRRTLVSYSRRLYAKDGLVKGAIDTQAQHAIGRADQLVHDLLLIGVKTEIAQPEQQTALVENTHDDALPVVRGQARYA